MSLGRHKKIKNFNTGFRQCSQMSKNHPDNTFLIKSKLEMLQHIQIKKKSISKFHFPVKLYETQKNAMTQHY